MKTTKQRKNPVSLRISVTDRCQLRCLYCMPPAEGNKKCCHTDLLTFSEIMNFVNLLKSHYSISKIHITGGEPLVRNGIVELIKRLSTTEICDIVLTTNGQLLVGMAKDLKRAGLRRVNISLDSLNPGNFYRLTGGGELHRTLAGIDAVIECGFSPIKLNTVVLNNINDNEVTDIAIYGIERNCQVRFLELMPIGVNAAHFHDLFVSSDEVNMRLAKRFELYALAEQSGGSSRNYIAHDSDGRTGIIGFISPYTSPFCGGCRRLRLKADGKLIGCLAHEKGFEIRSLLQDESSLNEFPLIEVVNSALNIKHKNRRFESCEAMVNIGG